jgi:hypothetical protein
MGSRGGSLLRPFSSLEESFFGKMKKTNGQLHKAHLLDQPTAHRIQSPSPNIYSSNVISLMKENIKLER